MSHFYRLSHKQRYHQLKSAPVDVGTVSAVSDSPAGSSSRLPAAVTTKEPTRRKCRRKPTDDGQLVSTGNRLMVFTESVIVDADYYPLVDSNGCTLTYWQMQSHNTPQTDVGSLHSRQEVTF
jgi:outer membrane lipoprotein-sorting protein